MRFHQNLRTSQLSLTALAVALAVVGSISAAAQTESLLYSFQGGTDGSEPVASLIDPAGNLYGTTLGGGVYGFGTVYELSPPAHPGNPWTETLLYSFQGGPDGALPYSSLIFDDEGNLYGTTSGGGNQASCIECGAVFKLTPPHKKGGAWKESLIYSFGGADGANPFKGLVLDKHGNLYGTTYAGGTNGAGTVFELTPPAHNAPGAWSQRVLYSFAGGNDGAIPFSDLVLDKPGNLYGTTLSGGTWGYGVVFQLLRPAGPGLSWTEAAIYSFTGGSDGAEPYDGVAFDAHGNLDGVAAFGGDLGCGGNGCGTVYQLTPPSTRGGDWAENTLYAFTGGADGAQPIARPVVDGKGKLYGTASVGGSSSSFCSPFCGTVYELAPPTRSTPSWVETTLYGFVGDTDGYFPGASLLPGKHGAFYGTTAAGGVPGGGGVIFQIVP